MTKNQIFSRTSYLVVLCWLLLVPLGSFGQSITIDSGSPTYIGQSASFTLNQPCGTVSAISWNTDGGSINWQSGSSVSISWASVGNKNVSVSFTYVCDNVSYYSSALTSLEIVAPPPCQPATPCASFVSNNDPLVQNFVRFDCLLPCVMYSITITFSDGTPPSTISISGTISGIDYYEFTPALGTYIKSACITSPQTAPVCI